MILSRRSVVLGTALAGLAMPARAAIGIDGFKGALDAGNLGVQPDTPLDQTEQLQTALNAATKLGNPLFLPPGRYMVSGLVMRPGAHLVGVPGASHLFLSRAGAAVRAERARRISLIGITIDGLGLPVSARDGLLTAREVEDLVVEGCTITGSATNGILLDSTGGRIANTTITNCGDAGLFSTNASNLRITGNTITDCENNGILVWRTTKGEDGTFVTENRIARIGAQRGGDGQYGNGVNIFRAGNVTVANNRITDCAFTAVRSNAGSACQILGNNCSRLGEVAVYAEFGFEGAVIANNIIDTAATGISMTNFSDGGRLAVCTGNLVRNLYHRDHEDRRGVGIGAEADAVISANVVESAPTMGLLLGWGPHLRDVTATGNIVRDAAIGIGVSVADGAGNAVVSDNIISGSRNGAIVGMAWDDIVTGDLGRKAESGYPHLAISRNRVT